MRGYLLAAMADDPGGRLPSERRIAEELGVSRPTVRRALEQLAVEGRVRRVHGSGTFAAQPPERADEPAAVHVLAADEILAGATRSSKLGVSPHEPLWRVMRLRIVDGVPVRLETAWIVKARAPRPLVELDAAIVRTRQRVTATVLESAAARLLEVPPLSPALAIERLSWDASGRRVELAEWLCRGDRYALELSLEPGARV